MADVDDEVVVEAVCPEAVVSELVVVGGDEFPVVEVVVEVDVPLAVPALADPPVPEPFEGAVHHLVMKVAVVLPVECDPVTVTGGFTVVGFELVAVFDELCVLAVPPLIVG